MLDIGCGCRDTSRQVARAGVQVTGVDISAPMPAAARQRAAAEDLPVEFVLADASTHPFGADRDVLFSRFGVMFFADPAGAFANLRTSLTRGGRMAFVCWQAASANAWMAALAAAIARFLPPTPPADPRAPGPFAFADRACLVGILGQAGFAEVPVEPIEADLLMGRNVDDAMLFTRKVGPLSRPLAAPSFRCTARQSRSARPPSTRVPASVPLRSDPRTRSRYRVRPASARGRGR